MTTDDGLKGFAPSLEPYCFIVEPKESDDCSWPWNIHKTAEQCERDIEEGRIVIPVYRHPALKAANVHDSGDGVRVRALLERVAMYRELARVHDQAYGYTNKQCAVVYRKCADELAAILAIKGEV